MTIKSKILTLALTLVCGISWSQDKMLEVLRSELKEQMQVLSKKSDMAPYYMDYKVTEMDVNYVQSSFGAVVSKNSSSNRYFTPHIRIGDPKVFDNYYFSSQLVKPGQTTTYLPAKDVNDPAIRMAIWNVVDITYNVAKQGYTYYKSQFDVNNKQEDSAPVFSKVKPETYFEAPLQGNQYNFDEANWTKKVNAYSERFNEDKNLISGSAYVVLKKFRKYFVSSEGASVVQNQTYAQLMVSATTKAEDGMELPLHLSYFSFTPEGLPSSEKVNADITEMIKTLAALRVAPIATPYSGPAIMAGGAAGVFFHEIFGHRIEGQRMKTNRDGQTFKSMVGKQLLPKSMQVFDDPSLKTYNGEELNGYYLYDEQGVKGRRVDVIKDGMLNEFLMSRTAIDGFLASNGHARADMGYDPTTRQSNLIIETKEHKTDAELRSLLKKEMKKQGKDFGYFFKKVSAGLAYTGAGQVNSFNVTPLEVYKVYIDGRPDELVRGVDMIGTPLSIFENIAYGGGDSEMFIGTCGAESGGIPVTAIAPTMLITKVEVQRKAKSDNQPPLLPKPVK